MGHTNDHESISLLMERGQGKALFDPLDDGEAARLRSVLAAWGDNGSQLAALLERSNGVSAWGAALVIRPWRSTPGGMHELLAWNEGSLWRDRYPEPLPNSVLCFGADAFGDQFALVRGGVARVVAESGEMVLMASDFPAWIRGLCDDPGAEAGADLVESWNAMGDPVRADHRLLGRQPFVLGGEYEVSNLKHVPDAEGMRICAGIASAIHGVPDGEMIRLRPESED